MKNRKLKKLIVIALVSTTIASMTSVGASAQWEQDLQNNWGFTENEEKVTGWMEIEGAWYYFDENGIMQTGWREIDGKWYYLNANGIMQTGWVEVDGKWYYFNSGGVMQTGWIQDDSKWYDLGSNGEMRTGLINEADGNWYFTDSSGEMQNGVFEVEGKVYAFGESGAMLIGTNVVCEGKAYTTDKFGVIIQGDITDHIRYTKEGVLLPPDVKLNTIQTVTPIADTSKPAESTSSSSNSSSSSSSSSSSNRSSSKKSIVAVETINNINVEKGTNFSSVQLPGSVNITLRNGKTTSAGVTWDEGNPVYNENVEGTYKFTGTINLPTGVRNPNNLKAAANIIVGDKVPEVDEDQNSVNSALTKVNGSYVLGTGTTDKIAKVKEIIETAINDTSINVNVEADGVKYKVILSKNGKEATKNNISVTINIDEDQNSVNSALTKVNDSYVLGAGTTDKIAKVKEIIEGAINDTSINVNVEADGVKYKVILSKNGKEAVKNNISVTINIDEDQNSVNSALTKVNDSYALEVFTTDKISKVKEIIETAINDTSINVNVEADGVKYKVTLSKNGKEAVKNDVIIIMEKPVVAFNTTKGGNSITQRYTITAEGGTIDLSKVKIVFTADGMSTAAQNVWIDSVALDLNVSPFYKSLNSEVKGNISEKKLTVSISSSSQLKEGTGKCIIDLRFAKTDWSTYGTLSNEKVSVYYDGVLVS